MNAIQSTVIISIVLCFNEVYGVSLLQNATALTPCSKFPFAPKILSPSLMNYKSNSQALGPKVESIALSAFPVKRWNEKKLSTNSSMDDLANIQQSYDDNIQKSNEVTQTLYNTTLHLLLRKMQTWMDSDEGLDTIDSYLGYDEDTQDLINISMTELFTHQRNDRSTHMDRLASLFYYSCDIKIMYKNQDVGRDEVVNKFQWYIDSFGFKKSKILGISEDLSKNNLKLILLSIPHKANICYSNMFGATVASMKMKMLTMPSNNEVINRIKRRPTHTYKMYMTVEKLAESYAKEVDTNTINEHHLSILGVLTQDIFGYAYNHFELLYMLGEYDIDENNLNLINEFSSFMSGFMLILVDRFFEFKGEPNTGLVNAMYEIMYFLNPADPQLAFGNNFSQNDLDILQDSDYIYIMEDKKSIFEYYDKSERNEIVNNYMPMLMDTAIDKLLTTFSGENPEFWYNNRSSKIDYRQNHYDKQELLKMIQQNNENALSILNTFFNEFTIGYDLYDKFFS